MRFLTIMMLLGALALAASSAGGGAAVRTATEPAVGAKKKCKWVTKVVHGRKRRVKVCHTVKPPPPPPPKAGAVIGSVTLGTTPQTGIRRIAAGDGSVLVSIADMDVMRIDPASMKVVTTIESPLLEFEPNVAVGHGAFWIADPIPATDKHPQGGQLRKVSEDTNEVVATIPVGRSPEGVAFTPGAVWTANHRSDELEGAPAPHTFSVSRVDLSSQTETRVPVEHRPDRFNDWDNFCCGPQGMTAGFGSVWVGDPTSESVYRIDPATNAVIATIHAPKDAQACGALTADTTGVWVGGSCDTTVIWKIDPQTNTVSKTVDMSVDTGEIAFGLGSLWGVIEGWVIRIDPVTGKVVGKNKIPGASGLAVGDGVVWVGQGSKLLEIRPT